MNETVIVSVERTPDGFVVTDGGARRHHVADEIALGKLVARLTQDEDLPKVTLDKNDDMVSIIAGVARRVAPGHADLLDAAEPIAHHVTSLVRRRRVRGASGGAR